eukprot:7987601-Karenia_brevis.AAC.1
MRQEVMDLKERQATPAPATPAPADPRPASENPFGISAEMDCELYGEHRAPDEQSGAESRQSPVFGESKVDNVPETLSRN